MNLDTQSPVIQVSDVSKWFGAFRALNSISLDVRLGERVVICGPSGSGKSTLIRCINRLERHEKGAIVVNGYELNDSKKNIVAARNYIGMVFQHFNLFPHLTALGNLTLGLTRVRRFSQAEAEQHAMKYLDQVNIADQSNKLPCQLSGGQQQRVAIARSLCMEPKIMLFDEPTSALDPEMISEVLEVMINLAESGMTMICVTHEMGFARKVADTMVFMDDGKLIEKSTPNKFFTEPESDRCQKFLQQILHH